MLSIPPGGGIFFEIILFIVFRQNGNRLMPVPVISVICFNDSCHSPVWGGPVICKGSKGGMLFNQYSRKRGNP